jgi:hypothetical protein
MTASDELRRRFVELTRKNPHQIRSSNGAKAVETLKRRVDSGGMVVVHQDIYLREVVNGEQKLLGVAAKQLEDPAAGCKLV